MAIYPPTPVFSEADRRLLGLLQKLILDDYGGQPGSNIPRAVVPLTDAEATELIERLSTFANSGRFLHGAALIEALTSNRPGDEARARELYLSGRIRAGRTRSLASMQWSKFQRRLGLVERTDWYVSTQPMSFDHFLRMESRLLQAAGVNPAVAALVLGQLEAQREAIASLRQRHRALRGGIIREAVLGPLRRLESGFRALHDREISTPKLVALVTVVTDVSVLFTTRDWGVAGTLSTLGGASAGVAAPD